MSACYHTASACKRRVWIDSSFSGCLSVASGSSGNPGSTETEAVEFQEDSLLPQWSMEASKDGDELGHGSVKQNCVTMAW